MTSMEKVIKGLEVILEETADMFYRSTIQDALALLKAQEATINELYNLYDGLCKDIREKYESDDVCGLCQYDGAYVGDSGDWMNECPGFETNECFCMKNSIRKMCGQPLIEEP